MHKFWSLFFNMTVISHSDTSYIVSLFLKGKRVILNLWSNIRSPYDRPWRFIISLISYEYSNIKIYVTCPGALRYFFCYTISLFRYVCHSLFQYDATPINFISWYIIHSMLHCIAMISIYFWYSVTFWIQISTRPIISCCTIDEIPYENKYHVLHVCTALHKTAVFIKIHIYYINIL